MGPLKGPGPTGWEAGAPTSLLAELDDGSLLQGLPQLNQPRGKHGLVQKRGAAAARRQCEAVLGNKRGIVVSPSQEGLFNTH